MKTGKSIVELAQELQRREEAKKDFVADTRSVRMEVTDAVKGEGPARLIVQNGAAHSFAINAHAHRQIGSRLKIPAPYYDRMLSENPGLLATNVNTWFKEQPERRMIRTLDGTARAFMSDRYRRLDNYALAERGDSSHAPFAFCSPRPSSIRDARNLRHVCRRRTLEQEGVGGSIGGSRVA